MDQLIQKFACPDKQEALVNLKRMVGKLHIELQDIPKFLEESADIHLSVPYSKDRLNSLIPQIMHFEESMGD